MMASFVRSLPFVGLFLLASTSQTRAFAPSTGSGGSVVFGKPTLGTSRSHVALGVSSIGTMIEDKPHLMIGGRGYYSSNLFIDQAEYDAVTEASARRLRKRLLKLAAGYTAVVCGSFYLRQLVSVLAYLPHAYTTYPTIAAMATCGIKSMIADLISQVSNWDGTLDVKRSLSGLTYGATILGLGSKLAYTQLLPRVCPSGLAGTALQCGLDNFVLAPLIWIPGAYVVKAFFMRYSVKDALSNYLGDIREQGLLKNYWKLWVPAQIINFSIMPVPLRVPFVAGVGFLWFLFFSFVMNKK